MLEELALSLTKTELDGGALRSTLALLALVEVTAAKDAVLLSISAATIITKTIAICPKKIASAPLACHHPPQIFNHKSQ